MNDTTFLKRNEYKSNPEAELSFQYDKIYQESFDLTKGKYKILFNFSEKEKVNWWTFFSVKEKRNIFIYMIGMMLYKFGLEAFNGSIVSLASNRYDRDAFYSGMSARTFERVGLMVGLNQACQCIGSILIAPLIKRWPTRSVLSVSIFLFSLCTALLMIIDAATGGKIKPSNYIPMYENDYRYYGNYPTNLIIPIYCLAGIAYGMVELIRRIIPRDIVGTDEEKLKRMDALVHTFYEIAGVSGALLTGLVLIPRLGNNYAFIITPILFTCSSIIWLFIDSLGTKSYIPDDEFPGGNQNIKSNYLKALLKGFYLFFKSVYLGGKIIFSNRKYIWLFPCYSLTLYVHRYIENGIAPQIAKRYLQNSEWSQIIVGGSNFGELLGALTLLFTTKKIHSPLFWLRLDSFLLFIVWYIPFYNPSTISVKNAWIVALSFIPFGFGASGDDVSLNAHIQSNLSQPQLKDKDVSTLSSVMAFLYSSYIILYAISNPLLGKYIDSVYNNQQTIRPALIFTVNVQVTIVAIIVFLSTFIPKGSFKFNPSLH
jgi:MFS family permease